MPDTLLLTIDEVADHLRISTRTVRRLIQIGELPTLPIGRSLRIRRYDLSAYVDGRVSRKHNAKCAGPGVLGKEKHACHTDAKTVLSGGRLLPGQTATELDALLDNQQSGSEGPRSQVEARNVPPTPMGRTATETVRRIDAGLSQGHGGREA